MISKELKKKFEKTIEIKGVSWDTIERICKSDANILRPIKGIAFEEYFKKIIRLKSANAKIEDGIGDSDVDVYVNGISLQLKTMDKGSTKENLFVGVALHKTHGKEKRPYNLYSINNPTFQFLVLQHPVMGVYIIPYDKIPKNKKWIGYLDDPAKIKWDSKWLNKWGLIGLNEFDGKYIDIDIHTKNSELPFLSSLTKLEDYELIEMLIKPEYFRAAVMGLKGNLKEQWFINKLKALSCNIIEPTQAYPKYDCVVVTKNRQYRIQVKGTSKNMCNIEKKKIGVEVMGTHGQFPHRGYKKAMIDYVAIIISEEQIPKDFLNEEGLQFIIIPVKELPLHYKIGFGEKFDNLDWNKKEYSDVIYPNIKLVYNKNQKEVVVFKPDIDSYSKSKGLQVIPINSTFRKDKSYILNKIPDEFNN